MKRFRVGHDGKTTFAIVQAEDELAAIGMVIGAGWAGARAMAATAGPGISLIAEFSGLAYYTEVPGVICDIQRVGPSTGLPTRTSQGDILSTAFLSHGDTKHILLIPCSAEECFSMAQDAFELAEQFQTLVFVMSDLDLVMNNGMADPLKYPGKPIRRDQLSKQYNVETEYLRVRAYPLTREVHEFIAQHERVYAVEQNRDAQMLSLIKLDIRPELTTRLRSISHIHGLPMDARSVTDEMMTMEGK